MNQSKFDSPGSSHSVEETSLLLCLSSCSPSRYPFAFSTLANETVMDWHGEKKAIDQRWYSRHGLINGLHSVSHGELIHYLLGHVVKVDLPGLLPFHLGDLHHPAVLHLGQVVEQVLKVVAKIKVEVKVTGLSLHQKSSGLATTRAAAQTNWTLWLMFYPHLVQLCQLLKVKKRQPMNKKLCSCVAKHWLLLHTSW